MPGVTEARVVSAPRGEDLAIVDAGLKAMSSDASLTGAGFGTVLGRPGVTFAKANEEHGYLSGGGGLSVGDLLTILPNHGCGAVNMWSGAYVVEDGHAVDRWEITGRY